MPHLNYLAHSMLSTSDFNLQVIAEGLETELQANYLAAAGQPVLAKGWLFGHPVPPKEFRRLLAESERRAPVLVGEA